MRASHRVGARHRYETWPLRSAPCLSSQLDGSSRRQVCTCHAAKRAGLWGCGQRKGVAHIPTGQTAEAARFNSMVLKKEPHGPRRLTPRSLLLRSADFITKSLSHLYTDSESRSHSERGTLRTIVRDQYQLEYRPATEQESIRVHRK